MKILLQQIESKLYVKEGGVWTEKTEDARDFPTALSAFLFSMHHGIADVEVVETFSEIQESF